MRPSSQPKHALEGTKKGGGARILEFNNDVMIKLMKNVHTQKENYSHKKNRKIGKGI